MLRSRAFLDDKNVQGTHFNKSALASILGPVIGRTRGHTHTHTRGSPKTLFLSSAEINGSDNVRDEYYCSIFNRRGSHRESGGGELELYYHGGT